MAGLNTIALTFENFYDPDIKDRIKGLPDARYDFPSKQWYLRKDLKNKLTDAIGEICVSRGI